MPTLGWSNSELFRNGRQGQRQDGVDISGANSKEEFVGVQCKNTTQGISEKIVKDEIRNAESFRPKINELIVATTASRDAKLQKSIRELSEDRKGNGLFTVNLLFWDDICNDLVEDEDKFYKHYPQLKPKENKSLIHDEKLFDELVNLLSSNGVISFLDTNNMAGFPFRNNQLDPIRVFSYEWDVPEKEFLNANLDAIKKSLHDKVDYYLEIICTETSAIGLNADFRPI